MNYGCIGEHLKHSFSKEIHNALSDYDYKIAEIEKDKLEDFIREKNFKAINVTIPYKEAVMPMLDFIDTHAKEIGAVNTVVNRDGKLYGYNTDFFGMNCLFDFAGISPRGKKVGILGTGGTSKTSLAVVKSLGAKEIIRVSRSKKEGVCDYEEFCAYHTDCEIIINTTPCGMYPNTQDTPIDISKFPSLILVVDAIYNPLRSNLIMDAQKKNIAAVGGLYMLVAQAVIASEIFLDKKYSPDTLNSVYQKIFSEKENIVLVGMPGCGKSSIGKLLSKKLNREFIDTDTVITEKIGMPISDFFSLYGEEKFREIEEQTVFDVSKKTSVVIATGGGVPLRGKNVYELKKNGKIYFLDRNPDLIVPTADRPLASTKDAVMEKYKQRFPIYTACADKIIKADSNCDEVAEELLREFKK